MSNFKEQFYNLIIMQIVSVNAQAEEEIDNFIDQFKEMPMFSTTLREGDIEDVRRRIKAERSIRLEMGALIDNQKHEKWFLAKKAELDMKYWERYKKYLLQSKKFQPHVVNTMDDILDILTDLLGNPVSSTEFQRRGLIIGDVQSGKTANYTGLICKAADTGYKVIVLLTGTIEKLRRQTQSRLDEGFVGIDSQAMMKQKENCITGVGQYDPTVHAMVLTSTYDDFKEANARNLGFNLNTINGTVIFVVKKNVSVLKRLNKWLRTFNQIGENKIDNSLLVVDDEADNASVNTNPEDRDATAINSQIRELINLFTRASYVGFTATPFANIFIDPDTTDKMVNEDLFPKDYIYSLNAPSNYIGARNIFGEGGTHQKMLVEINKDKIEAVLPNKHKSTFLVQEIPEDMKEAIATFLVANAIRDLRGDDTAHRSMLINVSRFTNVQEQLGNIVNAYLKEMQATARLNCKLPMSQALNNKHMEELHRIFYKYYNQLGHTWEEVKNVLYKSIAPIRVVVVNQNNQKELNYEEYENIGMRVIAIGGLSLSRGLTLEGLVVSYFYRNSKMYDTLMQMGRWFGYRNRYDDLCRIWMTDESIEWYRHISNATDELRLEVKKYEDSELTPMDFGLRVRSDINTLLVTARNKMRSASNVVKSISLSGEVIETPEISSDLENNQINLRSVQRLINRAVEQGNNLVTYNSTNGFYGVHKSLIIDFLSEINVSLKNETFDTESIKDFVEGYIGEELDYWDIAFPSGTAPNKTFKLDDTHTIKCIMRSFSLSKKSKIIKMSASKRRLGTSNDGKFGLEDTQIKKAKQNAQERARRNKLENPTPDPTQKEYFINIKRNPLLTIYLIDLKDNKGDFKDGEKQIRARFNDTPLVGFGIGIPTLSNNETKYAKYTINKIAKSLMEDDEYDIGDEE